MMQHPHVNEQYVEAKWQGYDNVWLMTRQNQLTTVLFVHQVSYENEEYIYFGPLFSKSSAYLQLLDEQFTSFFQADKTIHLAAEIQNPQVVIVMKTLFDHYLYPQWHGEERPPQSVQEALAVFKRNINHIENICYDNMTSKSKTTLYQATKRNQEINRWLEQRGIMLKDGDNIVLYLNIPSECEARQRLIEQYRKGKEQLTEWHQSKQRFFRAIKEGLA